MQMVKIGTRIIQDGGGRETAEAAKIRFAGHNSKLGAIIINVQESFEKCLKWAMLFMGGTVDPEIEINKEFYDSTVDPNLLMANIQLMDRGVIAKSDIRHLMRRASLLEHDRTDEVLDDEIESDDVLEMDVGTLSIAPPSVKEVSDEEEEV